MSFCKHSLNIYIYNIYFNVNTYTYHWWSLFRRLKCSTCIYDNNNKDLEFLVTNKITKIINCAAKHIPNHWESIGIDYLTYHWLESETNFPIDHARCFTFINDAIDTGEAVLVHSIKAHNRSIFIICVFLMRKYIIYLYKI